MSLSPSRSRINNHRLANEEYPNFYEDLGGINQGYVADTNNCRNGAAYKIPGTIISYVGGIDRTRDFVLKNAPGAPPPIKSLGPFGLWKGTRFGYILAAANDNSIRALKARGYVPPSPRVVEQAVKDYWRTLPDADYRKIEEQLQDLSEEQGYEPPTIREESKYVEKKSPRSVSGRRGLHALSPREIKDLGIAAGYDDSYNQQYNVDHE